MGNTDVQVMILKSPFIRTIAPGLLTIVLVSSISSAAHSQLSPEQQETESKAELDKFASRLWDEGVRIAFAEVDHNTLLKLRHHADLNVAAYAAWFGVVAASDVNKANGEQQQIEKAEFFGYLSGRLNSPLPEWWLDALLEYDASMPRAVFYTGLPADFKQTLGIWHDSSLQIETFTDSLIVGKKRQKPFRIEWDLSATSLSHPLAAVAVDVDDDGAVAFVMTDETLAQPEVVLMGKGGNVVWREDVGGGIAVLVGGNFSDRPRPVFVDITDRWVVVAGFDPSMIYCLAFSRETGKPVINFSTLY